LKNITIAAVRRTTAFLWRKKDVDADDSRTMLGQRVNPVGLILHSLPISDY